MSEQQKTEAPAMAIPPEAGVSITFKMNDSTGADVQVTLRGATATDWQAVLGQRKALIETTARYGWKPYEASRPQPPAQNGSPSAPQIPPTTQGQSGMRFIATILSVEFNPKDGGVLIASQIVGDDANIANAETTRSQYCWRMSSPRIA